MKGVISLFAAVALLISPSASAQEIKKGKLIDTKFIFVTSSLVASTIFDAETTFAAIRKGGEELNPIMRPFVNTGRPATYAFLAGVDTGVVYLAYRMKKDKVEIWWLVPVVHIATHVLTGGVNLHLTFR